jgi:Tol biopolymer transport system component/DNA-binding winged helix-turn-helix (wHTH) protein
MDRPWEVAHIYLTSYVTEISGKFWPGLRRRARVICYRSPIVKDSFQHMRIRFGEFEADLHSHELFRAGRRLRLPGQSFLILTALLERPGELVLREELRKRLWPKETFVDYEQALNAAVNRLREALRDSAERPTYVETVPRRGYRFIGRVDSQPGSASTSTEISPPAEPPSSTNISQPVQPAAPRRSAARYLWLIIPPLLVAGAFALRTSNVASPAPQLTPLTSLPAQESAPAFSPDGNQFAFAWSGERGESTGLDLYVKAVNGERTLRLTEQPAQWIASAWSRDGKQIAFARSATEHGGVFVISPLGGPERRVAAASILPSYLTQLSWSADDKYLLYSGIGPNGSQAVFRLSFESLRSEPAFSQLACWDSGSAVYSPTGDEIAFVCTTSIAVYGIYLARGIDNEPRRLIEVHGYPRGLSWSADGKYVVFANDAGDGGGLWRVDQSGTLERIPFGEEAASPAIDMKNERIAYVRTHEHMDIWRADLHSDSIDKTPERFIASTRTQMLPQYSPDGTRIAFQSNRSGSTEIWIADADGKNALRITSFNGPLTGAPTWCSDRKHLAFDSRASGASAIYVVDIEERMPKRIESSVDNLALPAWTSDCKWLIASNGNNKAYVIPANGGQARILTKRSSYYALMRGERVVFNVKGVNDVTLWEKRLDEEAEQRVHAIPELTYTDSWTATDRGLYFTESKDPRTILFYDFSTEQTRPIAHLPRAPAAFGGLGLAVSPDDRYLLYSVSDPQESDIMLLTLGSTR